MTRDVMQALAEARPEYLDSDAPVDEVTRRRELTYAMTGARASVRTRKKVRPLWGLGLVGAAAAAALVVATTAAGPDGGGAPQGDRGENSSAPPTKLDARSVLLAAAHQAELQPATTGAYWHTKSLGLGYMRVNTKGIAYTVLSSQRDESWTAADPRAYTWSVSQYMGSVPATSADEAKWKQAGSPAEFAIPVPGKQNAGRVKGLPARPGKEVVSRSKPTDGDKIFWLGRNVSMKDLRTLPQDPVKLEATLLKMYKGHGTEAVSQKSTAEQWLFDTVRGLILDMPVTPKTRAAAFRMLAGLKGVTLIKGVDVRAAAARFGVDTRGLPATAMAVELRARNLAGTVGQRILFDPAAGRGLGDQTVVIKPAGSTAGLAAGSVWNLRVIQESGWTGTVPPLKPTRN